MKPTDFPQANRTFHRPRSMTDEECEPLRVYVLTNHYALISCWRPTWRERLAILLGRPVWLWVSGGSHPPVALTAENPFPEDDVDFSEDFDA